MKRCSMCHQLKLESDFYRNRAQKDGFYHYCKECHITYFKKYAFTKIRKKHQQRKTANWTQKNPEKRKAHNILNTALHAGKITRQPCQVCGSTQRVEAHHEDYSKPLEVEWLCRKHHLEKKK